MSEVNRIIQDLEFCDSVFDYTLKPDDSGLLLSYIQELQQKNQQLKEQLGNRIVEFGYKENKYKLLLDEIREYIDEFIIYVDEDGEVYFKEEFRTEYNDLLQILDKVKE